MTQKRFLLAIIAVAVGNLSVHAEERAERRLTVDRIVKIGQKVEIDTLESQRPYYLPEKAASGSETLSLLERSQKSGESVRVRFDPETAIIESVSP